MCDWFLFHLFVFNYIDLFMYSFIGGGHMKVRGQLLGVIALPSCHVDPGAQTQVVRLNGKPLYSLSSYLNPGFGF